MPDRQLGRTIRSRQRSGTRSTHDRAGPPELYGVANKTARRLLNQAFFTRPYIDADRTPRVSADDPTEPLLYVHRDGKHNGGGAVTDTAAASTSALLANALDEERSSNDL